MRIRARRSLAQAIMFGALGHSAILLFLDTTNAMVINTMGRTATKTYEGPFAAEFLLAMMVSSKGAILHVSASATALSMAMILIAYIATQGRKSAWVAMLPIAALFSLYAPTFAVMLATHGIDWTAALEVSRWASDYREGIPEIVRIVLALTIAVSGVILTLRSSEAARLVTHPRGS